MRRIRLTAFAAAGVALMTAALAAVAQQAIPFVWVSPPPEQVEAGQEFAVTLHVSGADAIYGISLTLGYDPQILEVVVNDSGAVTGGEFFAGLPAFTLKNSAAEGLVEYALTLTQPADPVSGEGILGTITFRALTAGATTITPVTARLLSPQFDEVNGQRIALQIDEVVAQTQGMTLPVVEAGAVARAAEALAPSLPATARQPAAGMQNRMPVLIVGGLLFLIGLALFAMSVGGYARLRRGFEPGEQPVW